MPRSRLRNERANSTIRRSPAASSFLQANSGEVRRYDRARVPVGATRSVAKAWRWVSFPGEGTSVAVSTSTKARAAKNCRNAAAMRMRPSRKGRRLACKAQKGGGIRGRSVHRGFNHLIAVKITGERLPDQYGAARHLGPALVARVR